MVSSYSAQWSIHKLELARTLSHSLSDAADPCERTDQHETLCLLCAHISCNALPTYPERSISGCTSTTSRGSSNPPMASTKTDVFYGHQHWKFLSSTLPVTLDTLCIDCVGSCVSPGARHSRLKQRLQLSLPSPESRGSVFFNHSATTCDSLAWHDLFLCEPDGRSLPQHVPRRF